MNLSHLFVLSGCFTTYRINAWISSPPIAKLHPLHAPTTSTTSLPSSSHDASDIDCCDRRSLLQISMRHTGTLLFTLAATTVTPSPWVSPVANALVKGNAPPSSMKPVSDRPKCGNIEECQALAEQKERELIQQQQQQQDASASALMTTKAGTRYRDLELGSGKEKVQEGDSVEIAYKVLKLGKRSYDGISGEGTTVFSRGYDQEDEAPGPFVFSVGDDRVIVALNDAIVGMTSGGIRRMAVQPDRGWRKPGRECDGGPGGAGTGGELKTDYVVVPTAKLVATETCFDTNKLPFPSSYAQQRRMAQRFDQSLIMEVKLINITK